MDYAEVKAAFFQPKPDVSALPEQTPGRRLRDAIEPLATISFWSEPAYEANVKLGLDFLGGYVLSRSAPLGEAAPAAIAASFGAFDPGTIALLVQDARMRADIDDVLVARLSGARTAMKQALGGEDVRDLADRLKAACVKAPTTGRPLAAGLAAMPWPGDAHGDLWHACTFLREHRGDGHQAAMVAAGFDGVEANILTELWVGWEAFEYTGTRAWSPDVMQAALRRLERRGLVDGGTLTDEGRRVRAEVEEATERSVAPVLAALGDDLDDVIARASALGAKVVAHGWFPPDPRKRAAG